MESLKIDLAQFCRASFLFGVTLTVTANAIPSLRKAWLVYGARGTNATNIHRPQSSQHLSFWDYAGGFRVPHSWFASFYVASVVSSIFWAFQIATRGQVFNWVLTHSVDHPGGVQIGMTANQIVITWVFIAIQGPRRLYESNVLFNKPSEAKLSSLGCFVGIAFYVLVGLAVWVEGIPTLRENDLIHSIVLSKPSLKTTFAVPLFLLASAVQHYCHRHLSSLKKYTLPYKGPFRWVLCPHYTSECVIYISLTVLAAPVGQVVNKTFLTTLLFSIANLSITAEASRVWYAEKFGAKSIARRWRMVPFIY